MEKENTGFIPLMLRKKHAYGKDSVGGIFSRSDTKSYFEEHVMGLPDTALLPDSPASIPYFMIGDAAYPLKPYLITPFSGALTQQQQIYNYRDSRTRKCIKCAFGVLAARWRVFKLS
ncbi:nuclease harbi1-like protein [Plakobranchus ocellatus]|uniref:Nuclease harbi1-like protein n=1 Tax=Plakobranchus ocellatus TaxID=259542 RepID=A0AAV4DAN9_9GAST|nr:nuclease harbi1-like protein [Plakobranchus ocellatus]